MRKVLVNALSVTNPSGRHVLLGHLRQLAEGLRGRMRFCVLARDDLQLEREEWAGDVVRIPAPPRTRGWLFRALWERRHLARLARRHGATVYFTPSGIAARLPPEVKQVVFCQNPWALEAAARRGRDALKACLQRRAYRRAVRVADVLVCNSAYMLGAYRANAGRRERRGLVVPQAAADATHARAAALAEMPRKPGQVCCVSVMAPHKNAEAVMGALARVRAAVPEVRLVVAGSWPDRAYERKIRGLVSGLNLAGAVTFTGFLPRAELERLYAESQVFCLPSRCESFGIPAVEAQLFGTPVVGSTAGAMPEIGGEGGLYCSPDDIEGLAAALERLLTDADEWRRLSERARANAARFTWAACSRPLVDLFAEWTDEDVS